jgi:hypothetical protein
MINMAANVNAQAFIPEIWDAAVYRTLEDNLVAKKICRNYSNKVKRFGDTIHFNGLADPAVTSYDGTVNYENLNAGTVSLLVDQQNYYGFDVTDIEQAMANVDLKGSQAERAGYALRKACDTYLMKLYSEAGNSIPDDANCDTASILSDIGLMKQKLAENNVDENDMWLVINPWIQLKLELAGIVFNINEGINGKGGMMWAKVLGFDTFVTNQVYNSATTPVSHIMAGSYNAIVFAEALMKSEALRAETAFATHVRGLHIFGAKVVKPKELVSAKLTYNAESTI